MTVEIKFSYTFGANITGVTQTTTDARVDYTQSTDFTYYPNGIATTGKSYQASGTVIAEVNGQPATYNVLGVSYFPTNAENQRYDIFAVDPNTNNYINFEYGSPAPTEIDFEQASVYTGQGTSATNYAERNPTPATSLGTVCFCTGTLIRTTRGDVAVEKLSVGDLALTASGEHRPVRWIGHRELGDGVLSLPFEQWPVRVLPDAFGPGLPTRALYLSPGHPVLVGADEDGDGGHLVPIMCLINGTTIEREPRNSVTYWHVELDEHDILLAEGLPAESYLDWGDRPFFNEHSEHSLANPDFVVPGLGNRCRPVAVDGPIVEMERRRLDIVFATHLTNHSFWPTMTDDALGV